ncbi:hypothetical protein BT93_H3075 [Corymbia citriodora subsp. variegata]|nr:hypothetical protein BT93_H3075 [Corymbia citriodora subsp. variegata]
MTSIPATPAFTVPLPKHKGKSKILFCKKGDELKHMRNILGSMSGIKLGHLKYYDRQTVNAQIYPNKLHERIRQENPTNVSILPTRLRKKSLVKKREKEKKIIIKRFIFSFF